MQQLEKECSPVYGMTGVDCGLCISVAADVEIPFLRSAQL